MAVVTDIGALIVRTPDIRGGRPRIAGTGITVQRIVGWYKLGLSAEEIVTQIPHLNLAQVYGALAYYHADQAAMDRAMEEEDAEADRLERQYREPHTKGQ